MNVTLLRRRAAVTCAQPDAAESAGDRRDLEHSQALAAPASPQEARRLRHQVAKTLADWGIAYRADDVLGSCAEMLSNALAYGHTEVLTVDLAEHDGWLRLTVPDHNPSPPYLLAADPDAEDGRGVSLLAMLADAWGFRAQGDGKSVFAEFWVKDAEGM